MAKANNTNIYKYDEYPSLLDYLFGSDFEDYNKNKSFRLNSIIQLINGVNGKNNLQFIFSDGADPAIDYYDKGYFFTDTNSGDPSAFTKLILNKSSLQPIDLTFLFRRLDQLQDVVLKLENPVNPNNFFNFRITAIDDQTDYFVFDVEVFKDFYFGTFLTDTVYSIYFDIKSATDSDPLKLDKAGYAGNAENLDDRIVVLENLQNLSTNFIGQAYAVWTGEGLIYDVIYPNYYIEGVLYAGATEQITLDVADATDPRFDVIAVDETGAIKKTGIASPDPAALSVDTQTEIYISTIFIGAGATTPTGVSNTDIYKENVEFATSTNLGTVNFDSTTFPFSGTKCIDIGAFTPTKYLRFSGVDSLEISDFSTLQLFLYLKASFATTAKLSFRFINGTTPVSSIVLLNNGLFNYNRTVVQVYQNIVIPISTFTFSSGTFTGIEIFTEGSNGSGCKIDNISLQKGGAYSSPKQKALTSIITDSGVANATIEDDTFQFKGSNGLGISAIGKIITFTSLFTSTLKTYYDTAYTWVSANGANVVTHLSRLDNPHSVTKSQVGLGNVDNISDANKPVSIAAQAALDLKLDASSYNQHFKGVYLTEAALIAAHPTASIGDSAQVNETGSTDVVNYSWDAEESIWVNNGTGGSGAVNTDALPEGSVNLYFTVARFLANLTYANVIAALGFTPSTAPNDAQKNSDITKAEIEAKLTGEIITHTHPAVGGGGDMVLASIQTVTELKTFLAGKLGFRNVANTFTSFFTNANTAARTYTLQNRDGTLADLTDIAGVNSGKMNTPAGTTNYLSKFLTATTIGLSRLWDTGTFLGIGTNNTPTKDLTFGNQANREIGVELSNSTTIGRDLIISAGKTINYILNTEFVSLSQTVRNWYGLAVSSNGNVYACDYGGDIYMQTNGTGNFIALGQVLRSWTRLTKSPNGNVYACDYSGDIYMQTNGTGNFIALNQTVRSWTGLAASPNGNVYAAVVGGDIYMQTNGTGNFIALNQTVRSWRNIAASSNGNIYAAVATGDIYMQTNGTGNFIALNQTVRNWYGLAASSNGNVYAAVDGGGIYKQDNDNIGTANLDGGALIHKAGTGKGIGKSWWEVWTGQKTASGTDMQSEALRMRIDESGNVMLMTSKVFADNAAAIAGGLPLKTIYWTATGEMRMVV